jgi:hypothetical protein
MTSSVLKTRFSLLYVKTEISLSPLPLHIQHKRCNALEEHGECGGKTPATETSSG